jgi:hypothetical protein
MPKKRTNRPPARVAIAVPKPDQKTVVVVGSGRGGTSAVAGAIHLLGIRMVEGDYELNSEDYEIVRAYQRNMHLGHPRAADEVSKVIADRNRRYDVWGWKDPSADLYLEAVVAQLRNPHFVLVFRNPFEAAQSHVAAGTPGIEVALDSVLNRYMRYWTLLQKFRCPTLMVGYEGSVANPRGLVSELCGFLAIKPKRTQACAAAAFIDPEGGYRAPR